MITAWALTGIGEITAGTDLGRLITEHTASPNCAPDGSPDCPRDCSADGLRDGDIVLVTSKVVSKSEGRVRSGDRESAIDEETTRVVARRGTTRIVRNRLGLTMAAAGVDASNVDSGHVVLLPEDPDGSARKIRDRLFELTGAVVGVIITDTAGRAWREGQTDIAIGAAGVRVAEDFAGHTDAHGNPLVVTMPAVADELAGLAELASGKLGARPFVIVRGLARLVLAATEHGAGASWLIRPEGSDMFGLGAREAVIRALIGDPADRAAFGAPAPEDEVRAVLAAASDRTAAAAIAFAHGWELVEWGDGGDQVPPVGEGVSVSGRAVIRPVTP